MEREKREKILQRIERERIKRLGNTAPIHPRGDPQFLRAADDETRKHFGGTAQAILRNDLARLMQGHFPTMECIMPYELELVAEMGLDALENERLRHVRECRFCPALLSLAQPDEKRLKEFLQRVAEPA